MNILIVEDEGRIAKRTERMIRSILGDELTKLSICDSLKLGLDFINNNSIDLLLLDLNLNGEDGYQLLEEVVSESFHTIVVSAHKDRAIRAFEYGVLDFVGKPYTEERLSKAIQRIYSKKSLQQKTKYLAIKKKGKRHLINVAHIKYIKGAGIYTELHLVNNLKEIHSKTLDNLLVLLPDYFERIHKSYLVDMNRAKEIIIEPGSKYSLLLKEGDRLPIGRTRYKELKEKWF